MPEELRQSLEGGRHVQKCRARFLALRACEPPAAHRVHVAFSPLRTCRWEPPCFHKQRCPAGELINLASRCATQAWPDAGLCPVSIWLSEGFDILAGMTFACSERGQESWRRP